MNRQELIDWASPPCHECGEPIRNVEIPFVLQGDDFVPGNAVMVCVNDHRMAVELFS